MIPSRQFDCGRRRDGAIWLAVLYALATVLSHAAHDLDHARTTGEWPLPQVGCDDPGSHWAGHTNAPELDSPCDACPACQYRAAHHAALCSSPLPLLIAVTPHVDADESRAASGALISLSCRGPPRV